MGGAHARSDMSCVDDDDDAFFSVLWPVLSPCETQLLSTARRHWWHEVLPVWEALPAGQAIGAVVM